jgi:calcineurin-like phosphoesterase family protein
MGNHDRHKSTKYWKECGFNEVSKYPILFEEEFMLSHEPRYEIENGYYNIHGHLHNNHGSLYNKNKNIFYDVGVNGNNYKPIDFESVKKKLEIIL